MSSLTRPKTHFCIGYGGAPAVCPPGHTLESLRKALEIGASMLHIELRAARGGELVAAASLQRHVDGKAVFLRDHTIPEWRQIIPSFEPPLLALDEVLALASQARCGLLLDLHETGLENALARKLKSSGLAYANLLVAAGNEVSFQLMRSLDPRIPLAHRFHMEHQAEVTPGLLHRLDADAVLWPSRVLTRNVVRVLKAKGVTVYAGFVNLAEEMRRLIGECGVDGISTPYADLLLTLSKERAQAA